MITESIETFNQADLSSTNDYGEISVQVAPVGTFFGSNAEGKPIEENITPAALSALADKMNSSDEVLCDIDHASCRPGASKDTSAAGWFKNFIANAKGLFATLKFTKRGKQLAKDREYRYLSPTFALNSKGEPVDIHSISYTNTPAFKNHIQPILNTESQEGTINMTKEEVVALIKETVMAMNTEAKAEEKPAKTEEQPKAEEPKKEPVKQEDTKAEEKIEKSEGEKLAEELKKSEDPKEEPKQEEKPAEEKKETKEELKVEEPKVEKKPEVIQLEALNSAPAPTLTPDADAWKNLHGSAFFEYVAKHNLH